MELYEEFLKGLNAFEKRHYEEAVYHLRRVKRKDPGKISVRELLGRAYFKIGDYRKALREFDFILENRPDQDYAYFCAGLCLVKLGKTEEGLEKMRIAIALNPKNHEYRRFFEFYRNK